MGTFLPDSLEKTHYYKEPALPVKVTLNNGGPSVSFSKYQ